MPDHRQSHWGSGELSPSLWGADHLPQFASGARLLRNFYPAKYGTLLNRSGTIYCGEVKDSTKATRLLRFDFADNQSYPIEAGDKYFRMWGSDGTVVAPEALAALGASNTRARSTDAGATWSQPAAPTGAAFNAMCQAGSGRIVAVGSTSTYCKVSDDGGATWADRTLPGTYAPYGAVAYNGRTLVAGGTNGFAYSTDNGETWTGVAATIGGMARSIAWGGGQWLALVPGPYYYAKSYDGMVWEVSSPLVLTLSLNSVCFLAGEFIACGTLEDPAGTFSPAVAQIPLGSLIHRSYTALGGSTLSSTFGFYGIATDSNRYAVAVGGDPASTNVVAYKFDTGSGTWVSLVPTGTVAYRAIVFSRYYYVAVGLNRCSRYDGNTWTADPTIPAGDYRCIASGKGTAQVEVATPYGLAEVPALATIQSGDVVTLFHRWFPPKELRRYRPYDWRLEDWFKTPPTRLVTGLAFSPSANQTEDATHVAQPWEVVVTWEDEATGRESKPCAALIGPTTGKFLVYPDKPQKYVWTIVAKARRYHVYRGQNGEWGWIGSTKQPAPGVAPSFTDKGQVPIYSENPPTWDNPFQSDLSYPACGCYLDDRFMVGGSMVQPATIRGSKVSDYYNFDEPVLSTDETAVEFTLATRRFEEICWLIPLEVLIAGTSEAEWVISGSPAGGALTGTSVFARARALRAAARSPQPVVVGNGVIYIQSGGQIVRYFKPSMGSSGDDPAVWGGQDLTVFSQHLLEGQSIVDMAYASSPDSTIWIVRSDGALLSLTFMPEHNIWAWARHDSGGDVFEAVTVIPDGTRDVPFFVVKRTINGATKRYVEMLATREPATVGAGVFLDCSNSYSVAPTNTIGGLSHLEGRTVGVLADGTYRGTYTVSTGSVTFTGAAAWQITVGLPIVADFESLDYPAGRMKQKKVGRVGLEYRLQPATTDPAAGVAFGQDSDHLSDVRKFSDARDGILFVPIDAGYNPGGRCFLRHTQPFPIELRGITREVS